MLDQKFIREHSDLVKRAAKKKHLEIDVDRFLQLDKQVRQTQSQWEQLRADQKKIGKTISQLDTNEKQHALKKLNDIKQELKAVESELPTLKKELESLTYQMPSVPSDDVPEGEDDTHNVEIKKVGNIPSFSFVIKDHIELCLKHNLVDFERASKIAGSRTYFLKNEAAILDLSIQRLAIDVARQRGFDIMMAPTIVRYNAMFGTGYLPGGEDQAYQIEKDEAFLVGTSEVPVTSYHSEEILGHQELPLRYCGVSSCFRREAGAAGRDTKGLYRVHQFNKVEQVIICRNSEQASIEHHEEILENAQYMMELLELPYRVVNVCGGDLGQGQIQKFDIEAWMPSRDAYGETHSASRFYDFQARRLNLRYRDEDGKVHFCHTLNNTLIATPRILIPLLEIHQQSDGSINIPKALHPYTGFKSIQKP